MVVARVKLILQKKAENKEFNLPEKEAYGLVTIDRPQHVLGFEDQDSSLFDYS